MVSLNYELMCGYLTFGVITPVFSMFARVVYEIKKCATYAYVSLRQREALKFYGAINKCEKPEMNILLKLIRQCNTLNLPCEPLARVFPTVFIASTRFSLI